MERSLVTSGLVPRGRKAARGDERLADVLTSLDRALQGRTIAQVTVEEIADGAGLSRSAFYFYFSSKHAAVAAAIRSINDAMLDAARPFLEPDPSTDREDALRRTMQAVAAVFYDHRHLLGAAADGAGADEGLRAVWEEFFEVFVPPIARRIELDRASGNALPGPPAEQLARMLLWANERLLNRETFRPDPDLAAAGTTMATVWQRAIYGP